MHWEAHAQFGADAAVADDPPRGCAVMNVDGWRVVRASATSAGHVAALLPIALVWNGFVALFLLGIVASAFHHATGQMPGWGPAQNPIPHASDLVVLSALMGPMAIGGLVFIWGLIYAVAGKVEVRWGETDVVVFAGVGGIGRRQRIDVHAVEEVDLERPRWKAYGVQFEHIVLDLEFGEELRFGASLSEANRAWMAEAVLGLFVAQESRPAPER